MKILKTIYKVEDMLSKLFISMIILLVFFAAVVRWIGYPVAWSIDVAQLLFGWVVFFGADMALKNNNHIGIDILVRRLPKRLQRFIMLVNYILMCIFLIAISIYGFYLSFINFERLFNTIQISYSYATLSVPVGCTLMLITMMIKLVSFLKTSK